MLKKQAAIFFMFTAYAILLGHSIIPHHHHEDHHELTAHHHANHSHDGVEVGIDLSHLFSHFVHPDEGFILISKRNVSNTFSMQLLSIAAVLTDNFSVAELHIPPLLYKPPAEHFIYTSPHSLSSGLRAPPAFIS